MIVSGSVGGPRGWAIFLVCVAATGCKKHGGAAAAGSASAAPSSQSPLGKGAARGADGWGMQADRGHIAHTSAEPLLGRSRHEVAAHFGGSLPPSLDFQSVPLGGGRLALLLSDRNATRPDPFVLVLGPHHELLWARKRPLAGIVPGVGHVTLSTGPRGDVALFWFNGPSATVATRMWDVEGGLLMDSQVMETDACDALSVYYWPKHGWVVAAARQSSFLVQLLDENGGRDFGARGKTIASRWRAAAPVSIAPDTADSLILFQLGYLELAPNARSGDHLMAYRYDAHGTPLWRGALDAGRLPSRVTDESTRVRVLHTGPGKVLASLPDSAAGGHFQVEVRSAGTAELR